MAGITRPTGGRLFRLLYAYDPRLIYFKYDSGQLYNMDFFNEAITVLQTLVVALGAGLGIWGAINLLEGYGNDNRAMRS